jgi:ribosome recycling factor
MAVMAREAWTDERLGDLAAKVDNGFAEAKVEVRDLRTETGKGFECVGKKIDALDDKLDRKFDSLQRNMTTWFIAMFSTNITLAAAVVAAAAFG